MKKLFLKILYVLVRTSSIFSLPLFKKLRLLIYRSYFSSKTLSVGDNVFITTAHFRQDAKILVRDFVEIGSGVYIDYSGDVIIGNNVAISESAKIYTHNHTVKEGFSNWHKNPITFSQLEIEDDAWIGAATIILPQVTKISKGSIVGAGSVLTSNTEKYGIYVGNPAKLIGKRKITN